MTQDQRAEEFMAKMLAMSPEERWELLERLASMCGQFGVARDALAEAIHGLATLHGLTTKQATEEVIDQLADKVYPSDERADDIVDKVAATLAPHFPSLPMSGITWTAVYKRAGVKR